MKFSFKNFEGAHRYIMFFSDWGCSDDDIYIYGESISPEIDKEIEKILSLDFPSEAGFTLALIGDDKCLTKVLTHFLVFNSIIEP